MADAVIGGDVEGFRRMHGEVAAKGEQAALEEAVGGEVLALAAFEEAEEFVGRGAALETLGGQGDVAEHRKLEGELVDFDLERVVFGGDQAVVLEEPGGHAADEFLFGFGVRLQLAEQALEEAHVGFAVVGIEDGAEGGELLLMDFEVGAGGDGVEGTAVAAGGGDGSAAAAAVGAGVFGAAEFLVFGHGCVAPLLKSGGEMKSARRAGSREGPARGRLGC